jgi:hypothetical protein
MNSLVSVYRQTPDSSKRLQFNREKIAHDLKCTEILPQDTNIETFEYTNTFRTKFLLYLLDFDVHVGDWVQLEGEKIPYEVERVNRWPFIGGDLYEIHIFAQTVKVDELPN